MAVLKNTVQVNNGASGWNAGHVMDAMEEIFADLGWNSGTQKTGVPQYVAGSTGSVNYENDGYYQTSDDQSHMHQCMSTFLTTRSVYSTYYDVHANGTNNAYRLCKKLFIAQNKVDATNNTFTALNHQLTTADPIVWGYTTYDVTSSTQNIPELTFGTTYYAIVVDVDTFKIAASVSDANGNTPIVISAKNGSDSVPFVREVSSISDNNDITELVGDIIQFTNRTPGIPTSISSISTAGTGYGVTGTNVATTGGSGTGLTVDFTATGGILDTVSINTAGTGYIKGDLITITTGNADATFTVVNISGSIGQQFTLCSNVDDYDATKILSSDGYTNPSGWENYPTDSSNTILTVPTLNTETVNGQLDMKVATQYFRQTELESWCPSELRWVGWDANDYALNSMQKYIYASNTTTGMAGNIILQPNVFSGTSAVQTAHWNYTVPASGGRGALKLRIHFGRSTNAVNTYDPGEIRSIQILNVVEGWGAGETFTIPGTTFSRNSTFTGVSPANDIVFGTATAETFAGANDGIPEIKVTNLGAGTNFFQKSDNGLWGTLKLEHDATKAFGKTYVTFGIKDGSQPYQMWLSTAPNYHWLNRGGTAAAGTTDGSPFARYSGKMGLDYQRYYNFPNNSDNSYWNKMDFAASSTPTAYPLKIHSYKAQSPQDDNFAIIQFVQTINTADQQYATFYLHKGNMGNNIWDLDYVWQGMTGEWTSSGQQLTHKVKIPNYNYSNSNAGNEPADDRSLAREAFYGFYRDSDDSYQEGFADYYSNNIDVNNNYTTTTVMYFRDNTYDKYNSNAVDSNADFYRPVKGIPLSRKMMPSPYTLPDDFALLQVSTSPGLTNFRPGDTITISAGEVYEVIRAAWETNQNSLDNLSNNSSMGILLLARTT